MKKVILLVIVFLSVTPSIAKQQINSIPMDFTIQDTKTYNIIVDNFKKGLLKAIDSHEVNILNRRKIILEQEIANYELSLLGKAAQIINSSFYLGMVGLIGKVLLPEGFFSPDWPYSNNIDRWQRAQKRAIGNFTFEEWSLVAKSETQTLTFEEQEKLVQLQQQRKEFEASKEERMKQFEKEYGKEKPQQLIWDPPKYTFIEPLFNILLGLGVISLPFYVYKSYYLSRRKQEIVLIDLILSQVLVIDIIVEPLNNS